MRRIVPAIVIGLVFAVGVGCTAGGDTGADGAQPGPTKVYQSEQKMIEEFWAELNTLTLPPGAPWPAEAPHPPPGPDRFGNIVSGSYEVGYGVTNAEMWWFCAWEQEWLAQRGEDAAREAEALRMLNEVKSTSFYTISADAGLRAFIDDKLDKANLGDPTGIDRYFRLNCINMFAWATPNGPRPT